MPVQIAAARSAKGQLARYLTVAATHYEVPSIGGTESVRLSPFALILNSNPNPPTPTQRVYTRALILTSTLARARARALSR